MSHLVALKVRQAVFGKFPETYPSLENHVHNTFMLIIQFKIMNLKSRNVISNSSNLNSLLNCQKPWSFDLATCPPPWLLLVSFFNVLQISPQLSVLSASCVLVPKGHSIFLISLLPSLYTLMLIPLMAKTKIDIKMVIQWLF